MVDRRKLELAGWAIGALIVVLLGARLLTGGSGAGGAPVSIGSAQATPARAAPTAAGGRGQLVVDVEGEVARPGVYRVAAGSRAEVAITSAGGLTRRGDATAVNLAAPLHDGQQIVVPRRGTVAAAAGGPAAAGAAGPSTGAAGGGAAGRPISLSQATVDQLDSLDGIGPTLAQRIVQYREAHGGFRSVDELKQVEGIGEKRFESLKAAVQP